MRIASPCRWPRNWLPKYPTKSFASGTGCGGEAVAKRGHLRNILAYATAWMTERHRHSGIDAFKSRRVIADIEDLLTRQNACHMLAASHPSEQASLAVVDGDADFADPVGGRAQGRQRLCDLAQTWYRVHPAHDDSTRSRDDLWRPGIPAQGKIDHDQVIAC